MDALYLGNYGSGVLTGQKLTAPVIANRLGATGAASTTVEGACASGGIAVRHGWMAVAAGFAETALVVGAEKMSGVPGEAVTDALCMATDVESDDARSGLTFPGFFGLVASRHMHERGTTRAQLAAVAMKNRENAQHNPAAHFHGRPIDDIGTILASRPIADPLCLYDCSPISDGAAAVVISSARPGPDAVRIRACAQATGATVPSRMESLTSFPATVRAAAEAYRMADVEPGDIDVAEVHDCFTIAEIVALEDLGLVAPGQGARAAQEGLTRADGAMPVNLSGGLLSKGHPVGATGVAQCVEIVRQLRGRAGRQLPGARLGMAHNLGGSGGAATVTILEAGA